MYSVFGLFRLPVLGTVSPPALSRPSLLSDCLSTRFVPQEHAVFPGKHCVFLYFLLFSFFILFSFENILD